MTTNTPRQKIECVVTKTQGNALQAIPFPGELGVRIYECVSAEGWQQWLNHLSMLMNEYGLNTSDESCQDFIRQQMLGFFFDEGPYSGDNRFKPPNPIQQ